MNFEKRDILLIVGLILFMIGLIPFMAPVYAILIVVAIYFGVKFFVKRRQQVITREVGEGLCAECGSRIYDGACPNCDENK